MDQHITILFWCFEFESGLCSNVDIVKKSAQMLCMYLVFSDERPQKSFAAFFPSNHANKQHVSCLFTLLNANQMSVSLHSEEMF